MRGAACLTAALFLFITYASPGQQITGRVLDYETAHPVKYAQVYWMDGMRGTSTNANGEFVLLTGGDQPASIIVTSAPYKREVVSVPASGSQPLEILMHRKENRQATSLSQTAICSLLESALSKVDENYYNGKLTATSFHRDVVEHFDHIVQLSEAVIRSQSSGKATSNTVVDAFYAEDKDHRDMLWDDRNGGFFTYGWRSLPGHLRPAQDHFLGIRSRGPLVLLKYYELTSPGIAFDEHESLYVIDFDQKPGIKGSLLRGRLYVDSASHAIARVEYSVSPRGAAYILPNRTIYGVRICQTPMSVQIVKETGETNYVRAGHRWILASSVVNTQFQAARDSSQQRRSSDEYLKMHSATIVTSIDTVLNNTSAPATTALTIDYLKTHFESYDNAKTAWQGAGSLKADTSTLEVLRMLRLNNQLWERKEGRKAKEKLLARTQHDADDLKKDLHYMKETFLAMHPVLRDPSQRSHFIRAVGNAERHLLRPMSEGGFARHLVSVLESLHCGHTTLRPSEATEEYNRRFGKYFPFQPVISGRRAFLPAEVADSARGTEMTSINGTPLAEILQTIRYKAPTEGISAASKDYSIGRHFAELYAANFPESDSFRIDLRSRKTGEIYRQTFAATGIRKSTTEGGEVVREIDTLQTALITFRDDITQDELKALSVKLFPMLRARSIANLIIDLRHASRFREGFGPALLPYLLNGSTYYERVELPAADTTSYARLYVDGSRMTKMNPEFWRRIQKTDTLITYTGYIGEDGPAVDAVFQGSIYVLVSGGTNAPAADFARILQANRQAWVIGQEITTSFHGSCNVGETYLTLPHSGVRVSLPFARYISRAESPSDKRLMPDYPVSVATEDIVDGRDREMEMCVDLILQNCCTAKSN